MAGLEFSLAADVRQFQRAVGRDVPMVLEGLSDSLDDAARDGDQAGEKLERSFRDLADAAKRESRTVEDALGRGVKDGADRASEGMNEFRNESRATLQQTAASVRDVQSGLDAVQEIAANALAGFGPAGMVGGLVAATGIGLAATALQGAQEAADEMKQRITSAFQSAAEEGRAFLTEAEIVAAATEIIFDDAQRKAAQQDALRIGVDLQTLVRAYAGDQEALNVALRAGRDAQREARAEAEQLAAVSQDRVEIMSAAGIAEGVVIDKLEAQRKLIQQQTDNANTVLQLGGENLIQQQKINDELARPITPRTAKVQVEVDDTQLRRAVERRTMRVDIEAYSRNGKLLP